MNTPRWPIETDSIHKGDILPPDLLINIVKVDQSSPKYQFKILRLKDYITKAMAARGELATLVIRGASIVVLTDAEAGPYNARMGRIGARKIRRSQTRHSVVDLSKLTEVQRKEWDRDASKLAMMTSGLKIARIPEIKPHQRIE